MSKKKNKISCFDKRRWEKMNKNINQVSYFDKTRLENINKKTTRFLTLSN